MIQSVRYSRPCQELPESAMMSMVRIVGLAFVSGICFSPAAFAQYPGQPRATASSPAYSPYLNLLRPGNSAINYYGLVRPQIDFQNQVGALQQQYGALNRDINAAADQPTAPPTTGHAASFMSYSRYYPGFTANRTARPGIQPAVTPPPSRR
jgi:hypothetical protein